MHACALCRGLGGPRRGGRAEGVGGWVGKGGAPLLRSLSYFMMLMPTRSVSPTAIRQAGSTRRHAGSGTQGVMVRDPSKPRSCWIRHNRAAVREQRRRGQQSGSSAAPRTKPSAKVVCGDKRRVAGLEAVAQVAYLQVLCTRRR